MWGRGSVWTDSGLPTPDSVTSATRATCGFMMPSRNSALPPLLALVPTLCPAGSPAPSPGCGVVCSSRPWKVPVPLLQLRVVWGIPSKTQGEGCCDLAYREGKTYRTCKDKDIFPGLWNRPGSEIVSGLLPLLYTVLHSPSPPHTLSGHSWWLEQCGCSS